MISCHIAFRGTLEIVSLFWKAACNYYFFEGMKENNTLPTKIIFGSQKFIA